MRDRSGQSLSAPSGSGPGAFPRTAPGSPGEPPSRAVRALTILAAAALSLLVFVFLYSPLRDPDLWWHLKSGWLILSEGIIPRTNTFAQAAGHPWIDHQWGFQVLIYAIWRAAGPSGLVALKVLVGGALWLLAARIGAPRGRFLPFLPFLAIAVVASNERMVERPEIFSFLFLLIQIALLLRWRRRPATGPLIAIVGVQLLWANFHALAVLGVVAAGAFFIGESLRTLTGAGTGRPEDGSPHRHRTLLPLGLAALACAAALCATPYGIAGALHPFTLLGQLGNPQIAIAEFQSPFSAFRVTTAIKAVYVFTALLVAVLLLSIPRLDGSLLLLTAALFIPAAAARRNVPFFILAALPLIGAQLRVLAVRLRPLRTGGYIRGALGVLVSILLIIMARDAAGGRFYARDGIDRRFGGGVDNAAVIREAVDYVKARNLEGTLFNDVDAGGYVIWRMFPARRAFIDSRLEAVPPARLAAYSAAVRTDAGWRALDAEGSFDYALLDHAAPANALLVSRLYNDPDWALAHLDPRGAVFVRRESASFAGIEADEIGIAKRDPPPFRWSETPVDSLAETIRAILAVEADPDLRPALAYTTVLLRLGFADDAAQPLWQAHARDPDATGPLLILGVLAEMTDAPEDALRAYEMVLEIDPRSFEAHYNRGRLLLARGQVGAAIESFDRAVALRPADGPALRARAAAVGMLSPSEAGK
ncbi:MAG: tetratricopeptide repeat protein [Myxococcota bacterium]